jgi:hypothetical protein
MELGVDGWLRRTFAAVKSTFKRLIIILQLERDQKLRRQQVIAKGRLLKHVC